MPPTTDHRLPLEQAIDIARETCPGLEFAHSRGIVYRDLKPGDVWLTADGVAKIVDFGLAVAIDRSRLTTEAMMVGRNCSELRGSEQPAAFQEGIETSGPPGAKEGCQGHLAVGALP